VHVCILGHECCSHFVRSARNAGKDSRSPVLGTILLSLSGHPLTLSCSLEIAKVTGPAEVCGPWSFVSRPSRTLLAKNLADKFCQSVQIDTLAANDVVEPVTSGQDVCLTSHHIFGVYKHKIPGPFAITIALAITIDHGLIALPLRSVEMKRDITRRGRRR